MLDNDPSPRSVEHFSPPDAGGIDSLGLLTDQERSAAVPKIERQRALALVALERYGLALRMEPDIIGQMAAEIRLMDAKSAKKVRKALARVAGILEVVEPKRSSQLILIQDGSKAPLSDEPEAEVVPTTQEAVEPSLQDAELGEDVIELHRDGIAFIQNVLGEQPPSELTSKQFEEVVIRLAKTVAASRKIHNSQAPLDDLRGRFAALLRGGKRDAADASGVTDDSFSRWTYSTLKRLRDSREELNSSESPYGKKLAHEWLSEQWAELFELSYRERLALKHMLNPSRHDTLARSMMPLIQQFRELLVGADGKMLQLSIGRVELNRLYVLFGVVFTADGTAIYTEPLCLGDQVRNATQRGANAFSDRKVPQTHAAMHALLELTREASHFHEDGVGQTPSNANPEGVAPPPEYVATPLSTETETVPRLSAEQEVELSRKIEAGLYAEKVLDKSIKSRLKASNEQLEKIVEEGREAMEHMLLANRRLVVSIARRSKYSNRGMDLEDLISEGTFGLVRAIQKFDYTKGFKLSTYATNWIRASIDAAIMTSEGRFGRISVPEARKVKRLLGTSSALYAALGREPTHQELAEACGIPPTEVERLLSYRRPVASLDSPLSPDERTSATLEEVLPDGKDVIGASIDREANKAVVNKLLLAAGDDLTRELIRRYFGLDGEPEYYSKIAKDYPRLSPEVIRSRVNKGLGSMLQAARVQGLDISDLY